MRFDSITSVKIADIELDEKNYRFGMATSQQDCINKIYNHSPENFKNIMEDIAANDLGEQLLVYKNKNKLTILDGNRRASILKILNNPELSPNESIKNLAKHLRQNAKCDLNFVGAFVSDNLEVISKTVYERHAASGGVGRIKWSAYANARFRYDTKQHGDSNWIAIALLLHFQNTNNKYNDFISDSQFSFETFTRVIRSAYQLGYIDHSIFDVTTSALLPNTTAYELTLSFVETLLELLKNREISLSREGNYASAKNIESFLEKYFSIVTTIKPPSLRNTRKMKEPPVAVSTSPKISPHNNNVQPENLKKTVDELQGELLLGNNKPQSIKLDKPKFDKKILKNNLLTLAINSLEIPKFNALYKSLLTIDPTEHPLLTIVGIWSLLDSLARLDSSYSKDFSGYFKGKLQNYSFDNAEDAKSDKEILDWLSKEGNFTKHSNNYATFNGLEIAQKFNRIQNIIGFVVSEHILKALKQKSGQ